LFLTPWLAQNRLARSKGSAGSTAKVSRHCIRLMSIEEVTRRLAGRTLHLPSPYSRSSSRPAKIGRQSPPVGWFGRNSTLSSRQQANGFCDVPKNNSEAAILYMHLTIVGILPIVTSSKNDHPIGWLLWRLGQRIERIRYHGNYGSRCAHG
jgi:hypothetical protein